MQTQTPAIQNPNVRHTAVQNPSGQAPTAQRVTATEAAPPVRRAPALDVFENADALLLRFEIPGVAQGDVHLELEQRTLRLEATQTSGVGQRPIRFERTIGLPTAIDSERVSAELALGVLTVRLPKHEHVKPRTIPIRGAASVG